MNTLSTLSNTGLIVRYQTNTQDTLAFGEIYTRFNRPIFLYCMKLVKNKDQALDITQDVFIKMPFKLVYLKNPNAFTGWLYRIAHNQCIDFLRNQQKMYTLSKTADLFQESVVDMNAIATKETRLEQLQLILDKIPAGDKEILMEKYFENKSVQELMTQYGISCSAVKMRLKRSRNKVKKLFTLLDTATSRDAYCFAE